MLKGVNQSVVHVLKDTHFLQKHIIFGVLVMQSAGASILRKLGVNSIVSSVYFKWESHSTYGYMGECCVCCGLGFAELHMRVNRIMRYVVFTLAKGN